MGHLATGPVDRELSEKTFCLHRARRVPDRIWLTCTGQLERTPSEGRGRVCLSRWVVGRGRNRADSGRKPLGRADPAGDRLTECLFGRPNAANDERSPKPAADERSAKRDVLRGTAATNNGQRPELPCACHDVTSASLAKRDDLKRGSASTIKRGNRPLANGNGKGALTAGEHDATHRDLVLTQYVGEAVPIRARGAEDVDDSSSPIWNLGSPVIPDNPRGASQHVDDGPSETTAVRTKEEVRGRGDAQNVLTQIPAPLITIKDRQACI